MSTQNIGARLRQLRQQRGLTVRALAEAAKVDKGTVMNIEHGHSTATVATVQRIADVLGATLVVE